MTALLSRPRAIPFPDNEAARVAALHRLQVLDKPRREDLDVLVRLAAYICGTPNAVINLIDTDRQWPAAAHGYEPNEVPRQESMCATSITAVDVSYTPDASSDHRWSANPHVTGERSRIRLYAAAPLTLPGGEVIGTVCAFSEEPAELNRLQLERLRDIADQAVRMLELRQATERLGHVATRDGLTGLPNRGMFIDALRLALARCGRGDGRPAVLFLDVNGFKGVNDTLGHAAGDELLRAIADRLLGTVRATDLVARLSGDELVVLCDAAGSAGGAAGVRVLVNRLRACLKQPFELSCGSVEVSASIGVAFAPASGPDELIALADAAMYADKREQRCVPR